MKILIDFLPILLFFAAYKMVDIYTATSILMAATVVQMFVTYKLDGKRYATFAALTAGLDPHAYDNEIDKRLQEMRANDEPDIRALTVLAYRDAMTRFGHEDKEPLGVMPRLYSAIA